MREVVFDFMLAPVSLVVGRKRLAHVRSATKSDVVQRTNTDRYGLKRTITDSGSPIVFMFADAAWSVLPRVRHVRPVRHVRLNRPNQRRTITDDKPPIVFMFADAAWSVLPRVRPVRPVRHVRLDAPSQPVVFPVPVDKKTGRLPGFFY